MRSRALTIAARRLSQKGQHLVAGMAPERGPHTCLEARATGQAPELHGLTFGQSVVFGQPGEDRAHGSRHGCHARKDRAEATSGLTSAARPRSSGGPVLSTSAHAAARRAGAARHWHIAASARSNPTLRSTTGPAGSSSRSAWAQHSFSASDHPHLDLGGLLMTPPSLERRPAPASRSARMPWLSSALRSGEAPGFGRSVHRLGNRPTRRPPPASKPSTRCAR